MYRAFVRRTCVRSILNYLARSLLRTAGDRRVHAVGSSFSDALTVTAEWSASSSMKETPGRLISKTTTERRGRGDEVVSMAITGERARTKRAAESSLARRTRNTAKNRCRSTECVGCLYRGLYRSLLLHSSHILQFFVMF